MAARLRWIGSRLADIGTTFVDAFLRNNRVLPPVLAVLALFIIAWILAGAFMGGADQKPVAHKSDIAQSDLAQSDSGNSGVNPPSRGVENRDVNSYAAYRSKDPFRELFAPEETTTEQPPTPPPERTPPQTTTGTGRTPGGPGAGRANRDTDADGIPDRRERTSGTNPNNPDTDGDRIPDGSDNDANDDGRPDTARAGTGPGAMPGTGPSTNGGARPPGSRRDNLLNSGGGLPLP